MDLNFYIKGNGLDVSERSIIKNCKHFPKTPDNFYTLKSAGKRESFDFIYSKDLINKTKFYRILLKEWFYACKVGGKIIIVLRDNNILDFKDLKQEVMLLIGDKSKILQEKYDLSNLKGFLIIEKTHPILEKGDSMDKWTFGILTNGTRDSLVDKEIESILKMKIQYTEIIICGDYKNENKYKIKRVDFIKPEIGWITKKKNLICEIAKYENIVINHDRFVFDDEWYEGMKKYGNYFEVLCCKIKTTNDRRVDDWTTYGTDFAQVPLIGHQGLLEYNDWDKNIHIDGGLYILKKSILKKASWDNKLFWGQNEDVILSRDFSLSGIVPRLNPFSCCITYTSRPKWLKFKFNSKKLGKLEGEPLFRKIMFFLKKNLIKKHSSFLRDLSKLLKKHYVEKDILEIKTAHEKYVKKQKNKN